MKMEERLSDLERRAGTSGREKILFLRLVGMGGENAPKNRAKCGDVVVDRRPDETEEDFLGRAKHEVMAAHPTRGAYLMLLSSLEAEL